MWIVRETDNVINKLQLVELVPLHNFVTRYCSIFVWNFYFLRIGNLEVGFFCTVS